MPVLEIKNEPSALALSGLSEQQHGNTGGSGVLAVRCFALCPVVCCLYFHPPRSSCRVPSALAKKSKSKKQGARICSGEKSALLPWFLLIDQLRDQGGQGPKMCRKLLHAPQAKPVLGGKRPKGGTTRGRAAARGASSETGETAKRTSRNRKNNTSPRRMYCKPVSQASLY